MDIGIVDAHVHLWDTAKLSYPWLAGVPAINRPFLPADYREATAGLNVEKAVFLQCDPAPGQALDEAAWVASLAGEEPRLKGIVAGASLERGDGARGELEALARIPLVRGVRRLIQSEPDPGFCLRPGFVTGVRALAEYGFSFDVCVKGDGQLESAVELVRRCPGVRFVLDHIGKPFIKEGRTEPWKSRIRALAELPNAWCKVSGVATEADHGKWKAADLEPYLDHVIGCFGFGRVMFGGDWPVCTLATPYRRWVETLAGAVEAASEDERCRLFGATAEAFYRV